MKTYILFIAVSCLIINNEAASVFDKFTEGLHLAGRFLDFEQHAKTISQMVSEAFVSKTNKDSASQEKEHVFSGFLRLLGFGPKKLGAVVLNTVIFLAQLISTSLSKPPLKQLTHKRNIVEGNPFEWVANNSRIADLIKYAKTEDLTKNVIMHIKENSLDEDSDCLQLLICKSFPFIKGMQSVVNGMKKSGKGFNAFFDFLPSKTEVLKNGIKCEEEHPFCIIH